MDDPKALLKVETNGKLDDLQIAVQDSKIIQGGLFMSLHVSSCLFQSEAVCKPKWRGNADFLQGVPKRREWALMVPDLWPFEWGNDKPVNIEESFEFAVTYFRP